jgi:predicted dehydrogenase
MAKQLGIGMIGAGEIAVRTAQAIAVAESARHVIISDVSEAVAKDLGQKHGVPHTTDINVVLRNPDVDAVYIAVPHDLHAPISLRAIAAGKHVLVEKPIATTLPDADRVMAAAQARGVTLGLTFLGQPDPLLQRVRAWIASGAIGTVTATRIVLRTDKPESYWTGGFTGRIATDWRISKARSGGGVLIMNTVHDLNTMRWLVNLEVTRVYAEYDTFVTPVEVEDFVALTYRYANRAIGTLEAGSAVRGRDPLREPNRIYGTTGPIVLSNPIRAYFGREVEGMAASQWHEVPGGTDGDGERTAMVEGFARAVLDGRPPPATGEDGRAVLEIIDAAYRSGREGRPIDLISAGATATGGAR